MNWDEYSPELRREDYGRLIRSPIKGRKHITVDVCLPNGNIQRVIHSKAELSHTLPRFYNAMRKASWGGLMPAIALSTPIHETLRQSKQDRKAKTDRKVQREQANIVVQERKERLNAKAQSEESEMERILDSMLTSGEVDEEDVMSLFKLGGDADDLVAAMSKRYGHSIKEKKNAKKDLEEIVVQPNKANKRTRQSLPSLQEQLLMMQQQQQQQQEPIEAEVVSNNSEFYRPPSASKGTRRRVVK